MSLVQTLKKDVPQIKNLIRSSDNIKERMALRLALILKSLFTLSYCTIFVIAYGAIFGNENSIIGVAILICCLVFKDSGFGVSNKSSTLILIGYFAILAIVPQIASSASPAVALLLNLTATLTIYVFCCWQTHMFNHAIVILNYLLVYGYEIDSALYPKRVVSIVFGGALTIAIFLLTHKENTSTKTIFDIVKSFSIKDKDTMWQLQSALSISLVIFICEISGIPRAMWAGIAAMSVLTPFSNQIVSRFKHRLLGTVLGIILFATMMAVIPENLLFLVGSIGGFCLGFCTTYLSKVPFNTCGALCVASGIYGLGPALSLRLVHNILGAIFAITISLIFAAIYDKLVCESDNYMDAQLDDQSAS